MTNITNIADAKFEEIKKPKILFITDDIRLNTGVGIQARKLMQGLQKSGKYDIIQIAGSLIKQSNRPVIIDGIKLYPVSDGYGNEQALKHVLQVESPNIIVCFSDPRFFKYVFNMDNEIRGRTKIILLHTWDNEPYPKYNEKYYASCDDVVMISKFSHDLLSGGGINTTHIPHGYDPEEFKPLPEDIVAKEFEYLKEITESSEIDFIVFWNNRNLERKRPGDVIAAFSLFARKHPNALLILNTDAVDPDGTDLVHLQNDLDTRPSKIVYNFNKLTTERLNLFYNIADVTLNIAYAEGFGLSVGESLLAGTPVIATKTGGMPEQMIDNKQQKTFGVSMEAKVRSLWGTPGMPYIYRDYVSLEQIVEALEQMYNLKKQGFLSNMGQSGRQYIIDNFHITDVINKWSVLLDDHLRAPANYKPWTINVI